MPKLLKDMKLSSIKKLAAALLRNYDIEIVSASELRMYRDLHPAAMLFSQLDEQAREIIAQYMPFSQSQLAQDLFALSVCGCDIAGYFVEFGATDGLLRSNTWLLEKYLGWNGLVCEPAKVWHEQLFNNRSCAIDTRCVAENSGKTVEFLEASIESSPELSTIKHYADGGDWASGLRQENAIAYGVETVSLNDLLDEHRAPNRIDFLSIDTEGSEADILNSFDFGRRIINVVCVEHNYVEGKRAKIKEIMLGHGYRQVYAHLSKYDDWYVLE